MPQISFGQSLSCVFTQETDTASQTPETLLYILNKKRAVPQEESAYSRAVWVNVTCSVNCFECDTNTIHLPNVNLSLVFNPSFNVHTLAHTVELSQPDTINVNGK